VYVVREAAVRAVTRDELLAELLVEQFGRTTPEWKPSDDDPRVYLRRRSELAEAIENDTDKESK
jgi:hypothetical protein